MLGRERLLYNYVYCAILRVVTRHENNLHSCGSEIPLCIGLRLVEPTPRRGDLETVRQGYSEALAEESQIFKWLTP
jgi:hypothetical protein